MSALASTSTSTSTLDWTRTLRERLLERLQDARIQQGHAQSVHLAGITGRAYQTTRRWIDDGSPGLPDLASFRLLCEGVDADPTWLLGLSDEKRSLRESLGASLLRHAVGWGEFVGKNLEDDAVSEGHSRAAPGTSSWLDGLSHSVHREMYGCRARRMRGDEMEPEIADGDTVFIDAEVREFDGHGTYLIGCDGQELIRRLEFKVGQGLVVSCANPRYESTVFADTQESVKRGLQVLGRVEGVIQVRKFWRLMPGMRGSS